MFSSTLSLVHSKDVASVDYPARRTNIQENYALTVLMIFFRRLFLFNEDKIAVVILPILLYQV
jgi:hypothetical protein